MASVPDFDEDTPDQPFDLFFVFKRPAKRTANAGFTDEAKAAFFNAVASLLGPQPEKPMVGPGMSWDWA